VSIDCHIHLFRKDSPIIPEARHAPTYDALFPSIQKLGQTVDVTKFVLVQTSFMGTNNEFLLEHLRQYPGLCKGVFILDPRTSLDHLRQLKSEGVSGIRLNLFQTDLARSLSDEHLGLIDRCSLAGMSVGIHDDAARLVDILDRINGRADLLVIDHFGRPESLPAAEQDPMYQMLLDRMQHQGAYVKISAPYRAQNMNPQRAYDMLKSALGQDRLLWASDWPWTQNESYLSYESWADPFPTDPAGGANPRLSDQLAVNAARFYGFD